MTQRKVSQKFLIDFAPERWDALRRFLKLVGPPFPTSPGVLSGAHATSGYMAKYDTLAELTNRLAPYLAEDVEELHREGFTPAVRSKEFAALTETLVSTLYSALDGVRDTLFVAYRPVRGIQRDSTEKLFKRASEKKYGVGFPEPVRLTLAEAYSTWFPRLRKMRTAVTHEGVGSCHLDKDTQRIQYLHPPLISEDIVGDVNTYALAVRKVIEDIFTHLCAQLEPKPREVLCGTYKGRFYQREILVGAELTFASGRCISRQWFDKEAGYECPLRMRCGAYAPALGDAATPSS